MWDRPGTTNVTAALPSGMRTDAVAAVPGARGVPGRDADLLHHCDPAGDPGHRRGPPARDREQYIESQRILNAAGLAVPHWPVEWGGREWTPLQRHIWREEMQLAGVPEPLAFNATMIGPVLAAFGSQEQKERFLPATAN